MELLNVEHLKKYFPVTKRDGLRVRTEWYKAVDDISFRIGKGETFGLVGESGCGKTTVGKSILRLIEPTGGNVRLEGNELIGMNRNELRSQRKNMQMIFQDPYSSLDPQKRIVDTIGEPMKVHKLVSGKGELYDEVEKLLLMVGLNPQEARKYPHEFSGGQRQRIAIARALAVKPKLIVCEEPVSALDVSVQAQILNLMQDIQEQTGVSYLFIAHGMPVVQHISDRVGVMYLGKMVESTNAIDIFENPRHPYTKGLMSAVAIPDPDIVHNSAALKGEIPNLTGDVKGCLFCGRCPECKKICQEQAPELKEIEPGHMVACHLYD